MTKDESRYVMRKRWHVYKGSSGIVSAGITPSSKQPLQLATRNDILNVVITFTR